MSTRQVQFYLLCLKKYLLCPPSLWYACYRLVYAKMLKFLLGAYGYVHKGKAKGTSQDDMVFPIAAKIMKGKGSFIFCILFQHVTLFVKGWH